MDRPRRRSGLLTVAALWLCAAAPAPISPPPLKAMRWLAPSADAALAMTRRPVECLRAPANAEEARRVEIGRAAFRDPLILGGQAARTGISCESCHSNGRTNAKFDFPGISGAPGTADVRTFLFSSRRGGHANDPRPIPDLGGPKARLKVSQAKASPVLENFISGLVTDEFDGAPPPPAVIEGLAAYVRSMDPAACPAGGLENVRAQDAVEDARRAVRAAGEAVEDRDEATAVVMLQAARAALGSLAERYPGADLAGARGAVIVADLDLAAAIADIRAGAGDVRVRLAAWLARSSTWAAILARDEPRSLYDPRVLAAQARREAKSISN